METSPVPPSAPAPLPVRLSRASLANIIGWPAAAVLAVDRRACRPGADAASSTTLPPAEVTY
ncbi:MAG: hypothetical protein ACRET5_08235 [Steroidobacteraceae bacterium]